MRGTEAQHFTVEKGVSHDLQLNLDIVVEMPCDALRVNIQDASGDRILAGDLLRKEDTSWALWMEKRNAVKGGDGRQRQQHGEYQKLREEDSHRIDAQNEDLHAHHVLGEVRRNPSRKFARSPRLRRGDARDSCRIFGSLEGNKVQGDFHITARGHGYQEFMTQHLDHSCEFSFFASSLLHPIGTIF